jgi:hypothetical protein
MNSENTFLPWNGAPVRAIRNLWPYFSSSLSPKSANQLPRCITLFADPDVHEPAIKSFLESASEYFEQELQRRILRAQAFVNLGLLTSGEIDAFMTERTDAQPWALYYSSAGGLGIRSEDTAEPGIAQHGVIPCSSMRNHGVAWYRSHSGQLQVWLATSRKPHSTWDWDSDIGHESAHAAFAPVPLFLQALSRTIDDSPLASAKGPDFLSPGHVARILYFYSELAVVAIRGEQRSTPTGLPVTERNELIALLRLSDQLAPDSGFDRASAVLASTDGFVDVNRGNAIYEIAAPIVKVLSSLTEFTNMGNPPDLLTFRNAIGGVTQ